LEVCVLASAALTTLALAAQEPTTALRDPAALAIAIAAPFDGNEHRVEYREPHDHLHVLLTNRADVPQNVWQEEPSA
jgi:hypothetical protein